MTPDHSALIERLEAVHTLDTPRSVTTGSLINPDGPEAAAALRDLTEQKPFAHFQWNEVWRSWEQVLDEAAGQPHVVAAYRLPLPSAPNQAKEAGE